MKSCADKMDLSSLLKIIERLVHKQSNEERSQGQKQEDDLSIELLRTVFGTQLTRKIYTMGVSRYASGLLYNEIISAQRSTFFSSLPGDETSLLEVYGHVQDTYPTPSKEIKRTHVRLLWSDCSHDKIQELSCECKFQYRAKLPCRTCLHCQFIWTGSRCLEGYINYVLIIVLHWRKFF